MSSPPPYDSFEETTANCVFCKCSTEDGILYGDKFTIDNITFHHYCLLFASGLQQKHEEDEEILGYLKSDINKEIKRASKLTCFYCKLRGASIGCERRSCRKSFHFTCALENGCLTEFHGGYRSYCHLHHEIERSTIHTEQAPCVLCNRPMGKFNAVNSVELSCCGSKWQHSKCLRELVHQQNTPKCTKCGDESNFRICLQTNGIFVPDTESNEEQQQQQENASDLTQITDSSSQSNEIPSPLTEIPSQINDNASQGCSSDAMNGMSDDSDEAEPQPKKNRFHATYVYQRSFDSEAEASDYITNENWSKYYKTSSESGERQMLRCPKVKFRGTQCAAKAYLLYASSSNQIHFYKTIADHDHDQNINSIYEIPQSTKIEIKNMYDLGVTQPKRIINNLMLKKIEVPNRNKLDSYLRALKTEKLGPGSINLVELKKWLEENSNVPVDKTEPFIVNFHVSFDEKKPGFKFFASTKMLLSLATTNSHVNTDGTYKLLWQGYPVIQVGTTDLHRSFHPFGLGVCTTEQAADYEFIFESIKKGVKDVYNIDYHPNILIRDGAHSIQNGFVAAFGGQGVGLMCWSHCRRKNAEKLPLYFRNKKQSCEVLADLDKLQLCSSKEKFDKAAVLFVEKWKPVSADYISYFETEWLQKNRLWYEGACAHITPNVPSTNNAIESANRIIKDEHTLRERFDLGQFRSVLFDMLRAWSLAYLTGEKEIHGSPEIDLKQWTNAYVWAKQNVPMEVTDQDDHIMYKIPTDVASSDLSGPNDNWTTFDEFKVENFKFNYVKFPNPITKNNYAQGICDCSSFLKKYMCEHILGIGLRMKFVVAPDEAKSLPLGQKRKRGRPARAKAALIVQ